MIWVFPMAGLSSRFYNEGYENPKYMLKVNSKETLFDVVLKPFFKKYPDDRYIFIYRDVDNTNQFIRNKLLDSKIDDFKLVCLNKLTSGQAETVYLGLDDEDNNATLAIFNIDTILCSLNKIDFHSVEYSGVGGVLEVFESNGLNWSYAEVDKEDYVISTAEKIVISNYASNGMYYFRNTDIFKSAYTAMKKELDSSEEIYIAPLYNKLISHGINVKIHKINFEDMVFCGVPSEYRELVKRIKQGNIKI